MNYLDCITSVLPLIDENRQSAEHHKKSAKFCHAAVDREKNEDAARMYQARAAALEFLLDLARPLGEQTVPVSAPHWQEKDFAEVIATLHSLRQETAFAARGRSDMQRIARECNAYELVEVHGEASRKAGARAMTIERMLRYLQCVQAATDAAPKPAAKAA